MPRYFLEVAYNGKRYAGFQKQANANTVQAEVEKALTVFFKRAFTLTGSSRTDAGVHAFQNFFHFDSDLEIECMDVSKVIYHLNAMLPLDIVIKDLTEKVSDAHSRFDAISRTYSYRLYREKNPFLSEQAYYYPYTLDLEEMNVAAKLMMGSQDFEAFSKRSTQVHTFLCNVLHSNWIEEDEVLTYHVRANRFLRGMVRGMVGTMLLVGRGKLNSKTISEIISAKDSTRVNFAVPAHGLTLIEVQYP